MRCLRPLLQTGLALSFIATVPLATAGEWTRFRGPDGSGVANDQSIPAEFGPDKNLAWRIELAAGTSSPIVVNELLFLTSHASDQRTLHCVEASTGKQVWTRSVQKHHDELATAPAGPSTPTPVSDGRRIFVFFPDAGLYAWTMDGQELWHRPSAASKTMHGLSSSLVCVDDRVVQVVDQLNDSYIAAFDSATGEQVWKSERVSGITGGYSTPVVYQPEEQKSQVITTGPLEVVAYDVATGERLWWLMGKSNAPVSSPILRGNRLFFCEPVGEPIPMSFLAAMDGDKDKRLTPEETRSNPAIARLIARIDDAWGNKDTIVDESEWDRAFATFEGKGGLVSISLEGRGDVSSTNLLWSFGKGVPYIPGILVDRDNVFLVDDGGVVTTVNATTGKQVKKGRLKQGNKQYYASPVAAGDHVVTVDTDGVVNVLKNAAEWEIISTSKLEEPCYATPAISNNRIFIRTTKSLFCFAQG